MRERRVVIVAFEGVQPLDAVGPHEVFAGATRAAAAQGRPTAYRVAVASVRGGPVRAERLPGLSTTDAVVAIAVFVVIASLTIVVPVLYALLGGEHATATLESAKAWLSAHNAAVMAVLFLVFGVDLIAKGLPPLTS